MRNWTTSLRLGEAGWAMVGRRTTSLRLPEFGWAMARWRTTSLRLGEAGWAMARWRTTSLRLGEAGSMMLRSGTVSFDPLARHSVDAAGIGLLALRAPRLGMPLAPQIRR